MNADVWIATRNFSLNSQVLYEWYFMDDGWQAITPQGFSHQEPIQLIIYTINAVIQVILKLILHLYLLNFVCLQDSGRGYLEETICLRNHRLQASS